MAPLTGKIALVTGASRGIGKGIAQALGAAGATVYVTGRTQDGATRTVPLPGTIHESAQLVSASGGQGIAIACDHADDAQVQALFARIEEEQGRLDILVNNAWSGYQAKQRSARSGFKSAFWKMSPTFWDTMFTVGVRSAYIASVLAARLMVPQQQGLIVQMTAHVPEGASDNVAYGASKAAVNRMTVEMARELAPQQVTVLALCPDYVATEMMMAGRKSQELAKWMESPLFVGRAVVALATDPALPARRGQLLRTRDLARAYGFTDIGSHMPK